MEKKPEGVEVTQQLAGWRLAMLPVYDSEMPRFIPMCCMIFITIFTYALLRSMKDALIVTAPGSGAEVLSFLKIYMVLPVTILSSVVYMRLRKIFDLQKSYNLIVGVFVTFFFVFGFFLYPNAGSLHPSLETISSWQDAYPSFRYPIVMLGLWSFSLFYVFAELWGTFMLSVLFWQFANDSTSSEQAKRFYPLYVLSGNFSLITLYPVLNHVVKNPDHDIQVVSAIAVLCGLALVALFRLVCAQLRVEEATGVAAIAKPKPHKKKLSFTESIKVLLHSQYIGYIALLVLSYGITSNLVELIWKAEVLELYPLRSDYMAFNRDYTFMTGIATALMNYFSKGIVRKMGWVVGAIITPITAGICSCLFFIFILNKEAFSVVLLALNVAPMAFVVWFGAYGVLLSKGAKYSFFDPTKEMAFIPLDDDLRTNGKAAVDGIGARLGKSFGGAFASTLLMIMGSPKAIVIAPVLAVVVFTLICVWIFSVLRLGALYDRQLVIRAEEEALSQSAGSAVSR